MLKKRLQVWRGICCGLVMLCAASAAMGQDAVGRTGRVWDMSTILNNIVSTVIFGLLGIVLTIIGFKLFDMATPFHLEKEICEKQNMAVAVVSGMMMLGISIIIAMVILS